MASITISLEDQFPVSRCTPEDIPEMQRVWDTAFAPNPLHYLSTFALSLNTPYRPKEFTEKYIPRTKTKTCYTNWHPLQVFPKPSIQPI